MILDDKTKQKPEINYPCKWGYKIIGKDKDALLTCINEIMGDKEHVKSPGNISKGGKFHTYNASCVVNSQEEREKLFNSFAEHDAVKIVI